MHNFGDTISVTVKVPNGEKTVFGIILKHVMLLFDMVTWYEKTTDPEYPYTFYISTINGSLLYQFRAKEGKGIKEAVAAFSDYLIESPQYVHECNLYAYKTGIQLNNN